MKVRKIWLVSFTLIGVGMLSAFSLKISPPPLGQPVPDSDATVSGASEPTLQYKAYTLPGSVVHTLLIPASSRFKVTPAVSRELDTLENFAQKHQALAVLNGGFFDPKNAKTTSYVLQQGQIIADPRQNERLMDNPNLALYLDRILNRSEWQRYRCGSAVRYEIAFHRQSNSRGCKLTDALGGGPRLLPEITAVPEGFLAYADGKVSRDPLGSSQANARTAVGITRSGHLIWVMAAQKPSSSTASGLSLPELADFLKTLGVKTALNLDGGSSSALYYQGTTFYGKVDERENPRVRPVKSVLLVQEKN